LIFDDKLISNYIIPLDGVKHPIYKEGKGLYENNFIILQTSSVHFSTIYDYITKMLSNGI